MKLEKKLKKALKRGRFTQIRKTTLKLYSKKGDDPEIRGLLEEAFGELTRLQPIYEKAVAFAEEQRTIKVLRQEAMRQIYEGKKAVRHAKAAAKRLALSLNDAEPVPVSEETDADSDSKKLN